MGRLSKLVLAASSALIGAAVFSGIVEAHSVCEKRGSPGNAHLAPWYILTGQVRVTPDAGSPSAEPLLRQTCLRRGAGSGRNPFADQWWEERVEQAHEKPGTSAIEGDD